MKQVIQSYSTGQLELAEVPAPSPARHNLVIQTVGSLISVGTERYMLDMAKKSLVGKALARPDLVRQVINKMRTEGPAETYRQVVGRLDTPVPLGYSASGVVLGVGEDVEGFSIGDRVACAGSGSASHAEVLRVPHTLTVALPSGVSFADGAFVALGGIALHSVRMARITLGERVVVLGLGLLGQLATQIIRASGGKVFGLDIDETKVAMAMTYGASGGAVIGRDEISAAVRSFTNGFGADAVLIFASSDSNQPIELAAELARERGRIICPGLVTLNLPRKTFYEKELEFVVSRAWGPGMYDPDYESGTIDYPLPLVRWTAGRNMAEFLHLVDSRQVIVEHLITHRFPIAQALAAYEMILDGGTPIMGVLLEYSATPDMARTIGHGLTAPYISAQSGRNGHGGPAPSDKIRIGIIGAGLFAKGTLLPTLAGVEGAHLRAVATTTGLTSAHLAQKYRLAYCTTDVDKLVDDPQNDLIMILTRHGHHASLVCQALSAGKHVFVEKPLALSLEQLKQVVDARQIATGQLMVGFNRRFAPAVMFARQRLANVTRPLIITVRVNTGFMPLNAWVHDPEQGGGNIIGEVCHFVDLVQALTGSRVRQVFAQPTESAGHGVIAEDNVAIALSLADGSVASIVYTAQGDKAFQRERVEVFGGGSACIIENFQTAVWSQGGRRERLGGPFSGVDRGHRGELRALMTALCTGKAVPVEFDDYVSTTLTTFAIVESLRSGQPVQVIPIHAAGTS